MSAFRGKVRHKSEIRRNTRAFQYFQKLIANQNIDILKDVKDGNKVTENKENS